MPNIFFQPPLIRARVFSKQWTFFSKTNYKKELIICPDGIEMQSGVNMKFLMSLELRQNKITKAYVRFCIVFLFLIQRNKGLQFQLTKIQSKYVDFVNLPLTSLNKFYSAIIVLKSSSLPYTRKDAS